MSKIEEPEDKFLPRYEDSRVKAAKGNQIEKLIKIPSQPLQAELDNEEDNESQIEEKSIKGAAKKKELA